ncbi:hypothetical protein ACFL7D_07320 [candidate division KSB1 bacterium]
MTIKTQIDRNKEIVIHCVTGHINLQDIVDAFEGRSGSPEYNPNYNVLWDLTGLDAKTIGTDEIIEIANEIKTRLNERSSVYKVAFLANSDLVFGLTRMYESFVSNERVNTHIFSKIDDALKWLTEK